MRILAIQWRCTGLDVISPRTNVRLVALHCAPPPWRPMAISRRWRQVSKYDCLCLWRSHATDLRMQRMGKYNFVGVCVYNSTYNDSWCGSISADASRNGQQRSSMYLTLFWAQSSKASTTTRLMACLSPCVNWVTQMWFKSSNKKCWLATPRLKVYRYLNIAHEVPKPIQKLGQILVARVILNTAQCTKLFKRFPLSLGDWGIRKIVKNGIGTFNFARRNFEDGLDARDAFQMTMQFDLISVLFISVFYAT